MVEQTLWSGHSSQWKNLGAFALCVSLAVIIVAGTIVFKEWLALWLLLLPAAYAMWRWLAVHSLLFLVTSERLLTRSGIFSRDTNTLELYRVKDLRTTQSFTQRLVGLESVQLISSDLSSPLITVDAIPRAANLPGLLRDHVEACRVAKRTREVEFE